MMLAWRIPRALPTAGAACLIAALCCAPGSIGCPYSIRDAGFIVREPTPYKLIVVVDDDTPMREELAAWLKAAAEQRLSESNVEAEVVNVDDAQAAERLPEGEATDYLAKIAPDGAPPFPLAMLVSPRERAILLDGAWAGGVSQASTQELVRRVVASPARRELVARLVDEWCAIVLVDGANQAENRRAKEAATAAANSVVGLRTEMGQRIDTPPHAIALSSGDASERIIRWSLGLEEGDTEGARAAVVFGMGRRVGGVLRAETLEKGSFVSLLKLLGRNCTCTSDPKWLLGPAAPLVWDKSLQEQTREFLGFDPNSPAALNALSGVWRSLGDIGGLDDEGVPMDAGAGYIEFEIAPDEGGEEGEGAGEIGALNPGAAGLSIEQRGSRVVVGIVIALAAIVVAVSVVLTVRRLRGM